MPTIPRGQRRHLVTLENPTRTPNGDGAYTDTWAPLTPAQRYASVTGTLARDVERAAPGSVLAMASHLVTMDYHPDVTTQTRLTLETGQQLAVVARRNVEERNVDLVLTCVEVIP